MTLLRALFLCILVASGVAGANEEVPMIECKSAYGFADSVSRLKSALQAAGMTIFAEIDHAAGAEQAGMRMPPTLVLIYGNPKGGTPLMLQDPKLALDLPLRVLVRQDAAGGVLIAYHPMPQLAKAQELIRTAIGLSPKD